jgi:hypothetical protein
VTTSAADPLLRLAPPPGLESDSYGDDLPSAYFAVPIDAAANLLEAREYEALPRPERLRKALSEQQSFLGGLLDPGLQAAVELRVIAEPDEKPPITVAVLGRCWDANEDQARARAKALAHQVRTALPRHVIAGQSVDSEQIERLLTPFDGRGPIDSALITKHELIARPARPDAKVGYYFSVVPFNWAETDWTNLYTALAGVTTRVVLSAALLPLSIPDAFAERLGTMATFYGRLAREDEREGGLYYGRQKLAPDAFAVDAEQVLRDFARRYSKRAFALRLQLSAEGQIPPGLLELLATSVSPSETSTTESPLERERAAAACEIRRARDEYERQLGDWNLAALDFRLFSGRPEIWDRPDPPPAELTTLCVLADAHDASCAFRLPIALDGTVPGFRVRRGQFGHVEAHMAEGPAITLGELPEGRGAVTVAVDSLTKHALVVGSTGSGKTTTVLELIRQLWLDHRIPFLVIEPVNSDADDYRRLLAEPGFEALEVITVGDEGLRPLRFNPFEVPQGVLVAEHIANLLACFKAAFGLWEPLPSIYQDALNLTYLDAGILASERANGEGRAWPTAVEFMQAMRKVTAGLQYAGEVRSNIEAASIRRAEQLAAGGSASAFLTTKANDIAGLLDHPVIIELKSLGSGDEQALMMALLLNAITEHYQAVRGASAKLEHLTVIEEAHRLLQRPEGGRGQEEAQAKEKAAEAFANTLAENRKYGEGILIAEQLPTKLVADAVKNTNLKVMHRLTAEDDRRYLGETMGFDESQMRYATRVLTGEGLIYGDEFPEALLMEVHPQMKASSPQPPETQAQPPFSACNACRAQCAYRGASLAMVRDPKLVDELQQTVRYLQRKDTASAEREEKWQRLLDSLRSRVRNFPALPSEEPGVADAAYCLFLHSLAIRRMNFSPAWPEAVARRLGIEEPAAAS